MGCGSSTTAPEDAENGSKSPASPTKNEKKKKGGPKKKGKDLLVHEISNGTFTARYTLGRKLGVGGQATVYAVTRKMGEDKTTELACKMIDKRPLSKEEQEQLDIEVEMQLAVSDHQGFVTLNECISSVKVAYLVMEICHGGELYENIGDNYTEVQAAHYARQLCDAMAFMHKTGAVHRDLKPKNILISSTSEIGHRLRICDFGLAAWLPSGELIEDGVIKGTAEFLSMEMVNRLPYGYPTDVWAIGVIVFMLTCGRFPFDDPHREANIDDPSLDQPNYNPLFEIIAEGQFDFTSDEKTYLSDNARDFVKGVLHPDRDARLTCSQALDHPWLLPEGAKNERMETVSNGIAVYNKAIAAKWKTAMKSITGRKSMSLEAEEESDEDLDVVTAAPSTSGGEGETTGNAL